MECDGRLAQILPEECVVASSLRVTWPFRREFKLYPKEQTGTAERNVFFAVLKGHRNGTVGVPHIWVALQNLIN